MRLSGQSKVLYTNPLLLRATVAKIYYIIFSNFQIFAQSMLVV